MSCGRSRYCGRYAEPFGADCLVNYRRLPWQDDEEPARDPGRRAGILCVAPDLWLRDYALIRETLGTPKVARRRPRRKRRVKAGRAFPTGF